MRDYITDIETELVNQEIKSNKKTIVGFCWFFASVFLTWGFTMLNIFIISKEMITTCLVVTSLSMLPPLFIRLKADLSQKWVKYVILSMVCIDCAIITSILSIHAVLIYPIPMLFACQYRNKRTMWYTFVTSSITMATSCYIGFYYGICDLNLLMDSSKTRDYYLSTVTDGMLNIPFNENIFWVIFIYQIIPRVAILLIYTILLQFSIKSNYDDALKIARLNRIKDIDGMTGLYNKDKFDEMADTYYCKKNSVAVAFFDLNNLKTLNDNFGHEKGDYLIKTFADTLLSEQTQNCNAFRLGGDEFVLVLDSEPQENIEKIVKNVNKKLDNTHSIEGVKVTAAVGVACGEGADIRNVVKAADEKMYENKVIMKSL